MGDSYTLKILQRYTENFDKEEKEEDEMYSELFTALSRLQKRLEHAASENYSGINNAVLRYTQGSVKTPKLILKQLGKDGTTAIYLNKKLENRLISTLPNIFSEKLAVSAELVGNNLYIQQTIYDENDRPTFRILKCNLDMQKEQILIDDHVIDFRISPNENFIATHRMHPESDGIFSIFDMKGNKVVDLKNEKSGIEQDFESQLLGWTSDGQYFFYDISSCIFKISIDSWNYEKIMIQDIKGNGSESYNIDAELVVYNDLPLAHGISEEEIEVWKKQKSNIYVTHFSTGKTQKIAEKIGTGYYLEWISNDTVAIIDHDTGKFTQISVNLKKLFD